MTRHGARIRAADAASVRREPLVAHRAQVFRIRVEDVLATDLPRRVEERETDADGDLEQGALLAIGLGDETLINGCQLRRGRKSLRVLAQVGQRALEPLELERRDVDETCGRPARALERGEQVVDGRELGLPREYAGRFQLGDECVEVDPRAARDVRRGSQEPQRRETERENRPQLDDVSARLPHGEPLGRLLDLSRHRLGLALDPADELDRDPQQVLRRGLVEARLPHEPREKELCGLVDRATQGGGNCADDPLGHRDEVLSGASHFLARGLRAGSHAAEHGEPVEPQGRRVVRVRIRDADRAAAAPRRDPRLDARPETELEEEDGVQESHVRRVPPHD